MTVDQMREAIMHVYAGPTWRFRVQGMDNRQVIAIYKDMKETGRLTETKKKKDKKKRGYNEVLCEQITIYDILNENQEEQKDADNTK